MKLDIIIRIHDGQNIHGKGKSRYIDIPKKDLIVGCLSSFDKFGKFCQKCRNKFRYFK